MVRAGSIAWITGSGSGCTIHLTGQHGSIYVSESLSELKQMLFPQNTNGAQVVQAGAVSLPKHREVMSPEYSPASKDAIVTSKEPVTVEWLQDSCGFSSRGWDSQLFRGFGDSTLMYSIGSGTFRLHGEHGVVNLDLQSRRDVVLQIKFLKNAANKGRKA